MDEKTLSAQPTANSLKNELRESLATLKTDFDGLKHFIEELASDGISPPVALTKDDIDDLLSVTEEIHDAACDIEFEATKIKNKLRHFIV